MFPSPSACFTFSLLKQADLILCATMKLEIPIEEVGGGEVVASFGSSMV